MKRYDDTVIMDVMRRWLHRNFNWLLSVSLVLLALLILLPQINAFQRCFTIVRGAAHFAILGATMTVTATFFIAAANYHILARRPLLYRRTFLVAVANMFTSRLLPAGAGSIATFFIYLRHRRHTVGQASGVIAVNNFLGFFSHVCLLLVVVMVSPTSLQGLRLPNVQPAIIAAIGATVLVGLAILLFQQTWRRRVRLIERSLARDLRFYKKYPLRLGGAFSLSILLTLANAATLWYCVLAVHTVISPVVALAVFTVGIVIGTITPTPGGLGGTEAGLLAGLVSYHVAADRALATVILYRLVSYWLTLAIGGLTYIYVDRRGYLHSLRQATVKTA